ncbi:MAG: transposase [Rhodothermales bacterium]|nr:transposase [Rhodothermales bacterium]
MMDFTLYSRPRLGLSDTQWDLVKDLFDCRRKRKHDLRGIVDGILYVLQSEENWRMLPASFAPWQTVYYYFDTWRKSGLWFQLVQRLPEELRSQLIADARPSLSLVDMAMPAWMNAPSTYAAPRAQAGYTRRFSWTSEQPAARAGSQAA